MRCGWAAFLLSAVLLPAAALLVYLRGTPVAYELPLLARAAVHARGSTVVLGDSIVQGSDIPGACGPGAVNAGIGTTTTRDALRLARLLLPLLRPARVIVAIGVNDAKREKPRSAARFRADYRALLDRIGPRLAGVVEINPLEPAPLAAHFDAGFIPLQNAVIRSEAARRRVPVVPAPASVTGLTRDGVHPNAPGTLAWLGRLRTICR